MSLASALVKAVPGLEKLKSAREDNELTKDLDRLFQSAKNDRQQYERQWMINMAFYQDQQWLFWSDTSRRLERPRVDPWRPLATVNLVKGTVRTEYAKLIQQRPEAKTQPASDDPDDQNQAKVCDAILEYLWPKDGSESAVKRALLWAILTGTGVLKAYWDKTAGEVLTYPETMSVEVPDPTPDATGALTGNMIQQDVPYADERGNVLAGQVVTDKEGNPVHLGEIVVTECSPFEFYPDPFGLTIDQKSWCFTMKLRSAEYVMERFGIEVEPKTIAADDYIEGQMAAIAGDEVQPRKGVVVKEFWQRSTKKYPKGRYIVYVENKILVDAENPYPKAQLPYVTFVHIPVPGRFWGDSMVSSLIDPQKNLNKSKTQATEHRNLMSKGKYFVAKGALDANKTITSMPGEIVEYNVVPGVAKPIEMVPGSPIPDSYWKDQEQSRSDIREVSGVHEVSNATAPSGITAAKAIGYLQEQDDLRLGPTAQDYEDAIARISKIKLILGKQFYDEPRTARIAGPNNTVKVIEFYKDDIPDDVDVRVEAGSSLPKSRVARQHFITDLWEKKLITDPRIALRMLEMGDIEGLYDDVNRDIAQAERENELMKAGEGKMVEDFHNHPIHIAEHNKFRKGEEYDRLEVTIKQIFQAHVQLHQEQAMMAPQPALTAGVIPQAQAGIVGQPPEAQDQSAVAPTP